MGKLKSFVSIIIPCRNEESFIENVIKDIYNQDYPKNLFEVLIIDGMSTDNTNTIIQSFQQKYSSLKLFSNVNKTVPFALNKGIKESRGSIIIRLDAHCRYPSNYISYLVKNLIELDAGNVGVAVVATSKAKSLKAIAIAACMSSAFGIGNSDFRTGTKKIQKTDTVPFGCFKKSVFEEIGMFDVELIRNQDDEFNARMIKNGYKIYILPDIQITYYTRDNFSRTSHMFYYYGLFKPLVNKKLGAIATIRQLIPPMFVLANIILLIATLFHSIFFHFFLIMWIVYLMAAFYFSFIKAKELKKYKVIFIMPVCFIIVHFSYGLGYLKGIFKYLIFEQRQNIEDIQVKR